MEGEFDEDIWEQPTKCMDWTKKDERRKLMKDFGDLFPEGSGQKGKFLTSLRDLMDGDDFFTDTDFNKSPCEAFDSDWPIVRFEDDDDEQDKRRKIEFRNNVNDLFGSFNEMIKKNTPVTDEQFVTLQCEVDRLNKLKRKISNKSRRKVKDAQHLQQNDHEESESSYFTFGPNQRLLDVLVEILGESPVDKNKKDRLLQEMIRSPNEGGHDSSKMALSSTRHSIKATGESKSKPQRERRSLSPMKVSRSIVRDTTPERPSSRRRPSSHEKKTETPGDMVAMQRKTSRRVLSRSRGNTRSRRSTSSERNLNVVRKGRTQNQKSGDSTVVTASTAATTDRERSVSRPRRRERAVNDYNPSTPIAARSVLDLPLRHPCDSEGVSVSPYHMKRGSLVKNSVDSTSDELHSSFGTLQSPSVSSRRLSMIPVSPRKVRISGASPRSSMIDRRTFATDVWEPHQSNAVRSESPRQLSPSRAGRRRRSMHRDARVEMQLQEAKKQTENACFADFVHRRSIHDVGARGIPRRRRSVATIESFAL